MEACRGWIMEHGRLIRRTLFIHSDFGFNMIPTADKNKVILIIIIIITR